MTDRTTAAPLVPQLASAKIAAALADDPTVATVTTATAPDGTVELAVTAAASDDDRCRIHVTADHVVIEGGWPQTYNSFTVPIADFGTGSEGAYTALAADVAYTAKEAMNEVAGDHDAPLPFPDVASDVAPEVDNDPFGDVADLIDQAEAAGTDRLGTLHDAHYALRNAVTLDPVDRDQFDAEEAEGTVGDVIETLRYYADLLDDDPEVDIVARGLDVDIDDPAAYVRACAVDAVAALRSVVANPTTTTKVATVTVPVPAAWFGLLHYGDVEGETDPFGRPIGGDKAGHDVDATTFHYDDTRPIAVERNGVTVRAVLSSGQSNYLLSLSVDTAEGVTMDADEPAFDLAPAEVHDGAHVIEVRFTLDWSSSPARRTTAIEVVRELTGMSKRAAATVVDTGATDSEDVTEALADVTLGATSRKVACTLMSAVSDGRYTIEHTPAGFTYIRDADGRHLLTIVDRQLDSPMRPDGKRFESGIPAAGGTNPLLTARNLVRTADRVAADIAAQQAAPPPDLPGPLATLAGYATTTTHETAAQVVARRGTSQPTPMDTFGTPHDDILRLEKAPLAAVLALPDLDLTPPVEKAADLNRLAARAAAAPQATWLVTGSWTPARDGGTHRVDVELVRVETAGDVAPSTVAGWLRSDGALDVAADDHVAVAVWDY